MVRDILCRKHLWKLRRVNERLLLLSKEQAKSAPDSARDDLVLTLDQSQLMGWWRLSTSGGRRRAT